MSEKLYCVVADGLYGGRFVSTDGTFHSDVGGHLDAIIGHQIFRELSLATALSDKNRDERKHHSEVWEIELTKPWADGRTAQGDLWSRYQKIRTVHESRMPVPAPATKPKTLKDVLGWLAQVAQVQNVLAGTVFPKVDVTVGEFEQYCGKGSLSKFRKLSLKTDGPFIFAAATLPIEDVYGDPKMISDWKVRYGDYCFHTRKDGEEVLPTDKIYVFYTQIG